MNKNYDIIETATEAGNFQVFTKALSAAGLKQALKDDGQFTIFAPTDGAFAKVTAEKMENLLKPENRDQLQLVLRNHIVPGRLMSSELKNLDTTKTVQGEDLRIESRAGLWINEARVVSPDLEASNGVLHGIDTVLFLQARAATVG